MLPKNLIKAALIASLFSSAAYADGVWVQGETTDENQYGAGQTIKHSQFIVTYQNSQLPWGSQVEMVSGLRCQNGGSWTHRSYPQPLGAVSPYTWQIRLDDVITGDRYSGFCSAFEFVFRISLPNGYQFYDNGGKAPMEYYSSKIPYRTYGDAEDLLVQALASPNDYSR